MRWLLIPKVAVEKIVFVAWSVDVLGEVQSAEVVYIQVPVGRASTILP